MKRSLWFSLVVAAGIPLLTSCFVRRWLPFSSSAAPAPTTQIPASGSLDARVAGGVNAYRATKGKPPLRRDASLDALARQHSVYMLRHRGKKLISHDGYSTRVFQARQQLGYVQLNENVGAGRGPAAIQGVLNLWIQSGAHRSSMLGSWNATGVGTAVDSDGMVFVTQVFGSR